MPINIDGNGSIGGLVAGGLPDATVATANLVDASVTPTKLSQPMTLMTAKTATGTSVDFTGIPAWVKRITVIFNGVSLSGTADILVQIGPSGGAEITGYSSASTAFTGASLASASSTAGFNVTAGVAALVVSGHVVITNVSGSLWVSSHAMGRTDAAGARIGGGTKTITGTLAVVRITTVNGTDTFDAGSINVLYEG